MLLYGLANVESRILMLTNRTNYSIGWAIYPEKIPAKNPNSSYVYPFSTSFIFSMVPYKNNPPARHGIVFMFVPVKGMEAADPANYLGLLNFNNNGNPNNHVFGVEFDVFKNEEFNDISSNHVGIKCITRCRVLARQQQRCCSTGMLIQSDKILAWSFSNSNFSLSQELVTTGLPSFVLPKGSEGEYMLGREEMEEWESEYWPHRMTYVEIEAATRDFSEENMIGSGGNGKHGLLSSGALVSAHGLAGQYTLTYKGVLAGGAEIAVKCISHENDGMREFLAEISSLGRLKHRSSVGLRGWCKRDKGNFLLVYDYMENESLDKWVFECDDRKMLSCEDRIRILKDVASAVLYLHEGQVPNTTRVVRTVGYLAPEVIRSGRASAQTDVFGFGVLILEVMCGRRPIEEGKPPLVDWAWLLMVQGQLLNCLDERLKGRGEFDGEEVDTWACCVRTLAQVPGQP
ncbi:hypothetical protein FH972_000476 [Carpinus fangiana]|uniref:Protein kinase domain-containing protein n=1 Tax=Carpinus fangiana TaxID=176857 RepID=A0A5N6Q971_9ROSI|nr:hypothetical protein FH972_000476 [Carpinus fangiana]